MSNKTLLNFLALLVLVIGSAGATYATVFGGASTVSVGGFTFASNASVVTLRCGTEGTSANNTTCRKPGLSSGYTPTGNHVFRINAIRVFGNTTSSTQSRAQLLYSDNDVGWASATSFTNPVYEVGVADSGLGFCAAGGAVATCDYITNFLIPNGKYFGIKGNDNVELEAYVYGIEE